MTKPISPIRLAACTIAATLLVALPTFAAAPTDAAQAVAGDETPKQTAKRLQSLLDEAIQAGEAELVIPPGTYRLAPASNYRPHLLLRGAKNLRIVADGVTIVCTGYEQAVKLENCENVEIRGLTIDYDPLTFTQGTIVAMAPDGQWFDVALDEGYPTGPFRERARVIIYEPDGSRPKHGTWTRYGNAIIEQPKDAQGRTIVRADNNRPISDPAAVGDPVSISLKMNSPHGVFLEDSRNCTLRDVTLHTATSFGFFEKNGGGNSYIGLRNTPGPTPEGATKPRLLASLADGFHSKYANPGPRVENCTFNAMGDDGIAINGDYALVLDAGTDESGQPFAIISPRVKPTFGEGDRVHAFNEYGKRTEIARVLAMAEHEWTGEQSAKEIQLALYPDLRLADSQWKTTWKLTLDKALPLERGDVMSSPDRNGSGFVVRGNNISNHRARGILIKASEGIIENNTIDGSSMGGIVVAPETRYWMEADFSHELAIRGNTIRNVGFSAANNGSFHAGGIVVGAPGVKQPWPGYGHRDITIENNTIENTVGVNLLVTSAADVTIRNNTIISPNPVAGGGGQLYGFEPGAAFWFGTVQDVTLENNRVVSPGRATVMPLVHTQDDQAPIETAQSGVTLESAH